MEKMINARELFSNRRLDLVAKYIYVENKLQGYSDDWARELYTSHIQAITDGEKGTSQEILNTFDRFIENIQAKGIDRKEAMDEVLSDNAHRAAVCACLNMEVPSDMLAQTCGYDYFYFKEKNMPETYLDYMVTKYTQLFQEKCFVICMWPRACKNKALMEKADVLIHGAEEIKVVAAKKLRLNAFALRNFAIHCYCGRDWVADVRQHFAGVESMTLSRHDRCSEMLAYVVESPDMESILKIKGQLRDLFQMEFFCAHSSDNAKETQMMMQLLYNANSLDMMSRGCIDYDVELLANIMDFKEAVAASGLRPEDFILASSGVMGLYKLRKMNDLEYLSVAGQQVSFPDASYHGDCACYYEAPVETMVRDPRKHLYVMGMKCITLDLLQSFQEKRGSERDKADLQLIRKKQRHPFTLKERMEMRWLDVCAVLRDAKISARNFLERNNIYFFTKLWHFLRGEKFQ